MGSLGNDHNDGNDLTAENVCLVLGINMLVTLGIYIIIKSYRSHSTSTSREEIRDPVVLALNQDTVAAFEDALPGAKLEAADIENPIVSNEVTRSARRPWLSVGCLSDRCHRKP